MKSPKISIVFSRESKPVVMGPKFAEIVRQALAAQYDDIDVVEVSTAEELEQLCLSGPGLVFLGLKYLPLGSGERVLATDILARHNIPHTNSPSETMRADLDKSFAKQRVLERGIASARYVTVRRGEQAVAGDLQFPLFVKPVDGGGAVGVDEHSYVEDAAQLATAVSRVHDTFHTDALVEEYLSGREFSVAIIDSQPGPLVASIEVHIPNQPAQAFLTYGAKKEKARSYDPIEDAAVREQVESFALAAYKALSADGYGRVDVRMNGTGEPFFLEINLIPGVADQGTFMRAFVANGILSPPEALRSIVEYGLYRAGLNKGETDD